jgi:hypothetical protein
MAVAVDGEDPSAWPKPRMLFEGPYVFDTGPTHFDVARDGRFLMLRPGSSDGDAPSPLIVVQNWTEELKRLAPSK